MTKIFSFKFYFRCLNEIIIRLVKDFKDNQLKDILNSDQYMYKDLNETNYLYVETYENWKVKE